MKTASYIFGFLTLMVLSSSCSSSRPIVDDNVYMLNTAAIPIGENLLDETSYATYKYRKENSNPTTGYYNPQNQSNSNRTFNDNRYYNSMFYFGMMNPMSMGYGASYSMFQNPGFGYYPYGYQHNYFGFGNSYYNGYNPYGGYGFYNPNSYYGQYGSYYNPTCNNWYNGTNGNTSAVSNSNYSNAGYFVSGPRATTSGFYSGVNRGGATQLKSQGVPTPSPTGGTFTSNQTRKVQDNFVGSRPQYTPTNRSTTMRQNESLKYNNQQVRTVQSRGVRSNTSISSPSQSNQNRSTTINSSGSRNSGGSIQGTRSNSSSSPSNSSSSPRSGGRRQ